MKLHIIFPRSHWHAVTEHFSQPGHEQAALAYASLCQTPDRLRLLVTDVDLLTAADLDAQTGSHVVPTPTTIAHALEKAITSGSALIHLHNHLWHGENAFSETDLATFHKTSVWASATCQLIQAAVVVGLDEGAVDAVVWSTYEEEVVPVSELHIVGYPYSLSIPTSAKSRLAILEELAGEHALPMPPYAAVVPLFDRLIRAFGPELQQLLTRLRVGIVGLSGTGSHIVTGLAHLGVTDFVLIDPDTVKVENADRIVGATADDIAKERPKVAVAEREIKAKRHWASVQPLQCSVLEEPAREILKAVDVLFGCTDTAASRMLLNKLACQYHIPYIDVGTGIFVTEQRITNMGGQIHIVLPDSPCLDCREALNRERASQELMSEDQKALYRSRGYVIGGDIPQPQVLPLNGLITHQALVEFLNLFTAFKRFDPYLLYDGLKPEFVAIDVEQVPGCLHCSHRGTGDSQADGNTVLDTDTLTGSSHSLLDQKSNGGYMAKPIPPNPNFRRKVSARQETQHVQAQPPPPVPPTATPTRAPTPAIPTSSTPPTPLKRESMLRDWLRPLKRLF
jgi:molybdopterin/thiamine biosynthesis adenylyltransferase